VSDMNLPEVGSRAEYLGDRYRDKHWQPALEAGMLAEGDVTAAQASIQKIPSIARFPKLTIKPPPHPPTKHRRLLRKSLWNGRKNSRNAVGFQVGELRTVEKLVNPRRKGEMRMMRP